MRALPTVRAAITALDSAGVSYLIGGSIASSVHGVYRSTNDVDIVVELPESKITSLVEALTDTFYVDEDAVRDAVRTRTSFNILHLVTMFKVDLFLKQQTLWAESVWQRRQIQIMREGEEEIEVFVASVEDMILQKLYWFRLGGGVSDRQWSDILGMLKVQAEALDNAYLQHWALELTLTDLLRKAYEEAGIRNV